MFEYDLYIIHPKGAYQEMIETPYISREWRPEFEEYHYDRVLWKKWFMTEGPGRPSWLAFRDRIREAARDARLSSV